MYRKIPKKIHFKPILFNARTSSCLPKKGAFILSKTLPSLIHNHNSETKTKPPAKLHNFFILKLLGLRFLTTNQTKKQNEEHLKINLLIFLYNKITFMAACKFRNLETPFTCKKDQSDKNI